jgi:hypothetical protein
MKNLIEKYAGTPGYATFVTFFSFFAAVIGSVYTDEIKKSWPFYWGLGTLNFYTTFFYASGLIASFLFWAGQYAANLQREKAEEALVNALKTLPPSHFLSLFSEVYIKSKLIFNATISNYEEADYYNKLHSTVRFVLFNFLKLVKEFESDPNNPRYAANIMLYKNQNDIEEGIEKEGYEALRGKLRFVEDDLDVRSLKGILDLELNFSATLKGDESNIDYDEQLKPFALPIPMNDKGVDNRRRVLPGAPLAYVDNEISAFADTKELSDWCNENGDFSHSVIHQIKEYFNSEENKEIRSLVSVPLFFRDYIEENGELKENHYLYGVINIHSDCPNLLSQGERKIHLIPLFTPLIMMLADLLHLILMEEDRIKEQS